MTRRPWSPKEDAHLRRRYADTRTSDLAAALDRNIGSVYQRAYHLGLTKSAAYLASAQSGRLTASRGKATRYQPGHQPANKGLRRPGYAPGRMRETQFKKGCRPHTTVPIGTEIVRRDGYTWVKRTDHLQPSRRNWCSKHQSIYEDAHGPIPSGHIVRFVDGDKTHFALANLECVSRAEHVATQGIAALPPEIAEVHRLRGAITRQIHKRQPPAPVRRGRPPKRTLECTT